MRVRVCMQPLLACEGLHGVTAALGCWLQAFKPSIPNLVYQYNMYANFPTTRLCVRNPEIPED
jgi:hypothetical protein